MNIKKFEKPLKLKNDGQLEISFLGTGTAFTKELDNNNYLIIKGDTHILVDFGITGPKAIVDTLGIDVSDIDVVLPTHSHADHIGGLEYLTLYHRYVVETMMKKPKLKMVISSDYEKILWKMSLCGGLEWNESNLSGKKLKFSDYYDVLRPTLISSSPRLLLEIDYEGIHIEMFGTNHIPDHAKTQRQAFMTFGLFIDNKVMISGDTKFDRQLIDMYAPKAEAIFHDSSFFPNPVHASIDELRTLPAEIRQKLYLMHYQDNWQKYDVSDFAGLIQRGYIYSF